MMDNGEFLTNESTRWELVAENINYEVSELGEVRNRKTKRLLKQKIRNGYFAVNLSFKGEVKTYYVHQLVSSAFITNDDNKPYINHKDEIKTNSVVSNLDYVTPKENVEYSRGFQVVGKDIRGNIVLKFPSLSEATRQGYLSNYIKRSALYHLPYKGFYFSILPPKAQMYKEGQK